MTTSEYRMTSVNAGDILVKNDDPKIGNYGWRSNTKVSLDTDEFICTSPPLLLRYYGSEYGEPSEIIYVKNLRNDEVFSCFWWRFKKTSEKYDPTQMGDKEDDI